MNTNNITLTKDLLLIIFPSMKYWRFEVIYSVGLIKSIGLISFLINSPPSNGSCSIFLLNGTITTLFIINCLNWFDSDGIKDYSFYSISYFNRLMIGYNTLSTIQLRMPIGGDPNSNLLQIIVRIRDKFDCRIELNLSSSISVQSDMTNSDYYNKMNSNPFVEILYGKNQNDICQVLTSMSQVLNIFAQQNLQLAIQSMFPVFFQQKHSNLSILFKIIYLLLVFRFHH